jgi:ABC-2 type transport system ATP-binding protein
VKPVVKIEGVSKRYGSLQALDSINLSVAPGEIFALLGPNGAGKTTLIGCVSGLISDFSGRIEVGGFDVVRNYAVARRILGLVPQELNFDGFFKARSVLEYQGGFFGVQNYRERSRELLQAFSLQDKAEDNSRWLSGGMKRRLMICKALMHRPAVLFLDEPTAGVDVELRDELWNYVRQLREAGTTVVLTTHYLDEAEQLADRIAVIKEGRLVIVENRDRLLSSYGERWVEVRFAEAVTVETFGPVPEVSVESVEGLTNALRFTFQDRAGELGMESTPVPAILERIRQAGLTVQRIEGGRSRLEDIFRSLVSREAAS